MAFGSAWMAKGALRGIIALILETWVAYKPNSSAWRPAGSVNQIMLLASIRPCFLLHDLKRSVHRAKIGWKPSFVRRTILSFGFWTERWSPKGRIPRPLNRAASCSVSWILFLPLQIHLKTL